LRVLMVLGNIRDGILFTATFAVIGLAGNHRGGIYGRNNFVGYDELE